MLFSLRRKKQASCQRVNGERTERCENDAFLPLIQYRHSICAFQADVKQILPMDMEIGHRTRQPTAMGYPFARAVLFV